MAQPLSKSPSTPALPLSMETETFTKSRGLIGMTNCDLKDGQHVHTPVALSVATLAQKDVNWVPSLLQESGGHDISQDPAQSAIANSSIGSQAAKGASEPIASEELEKATALPVSEVVLEPQSALPALSQSASSHDTVPRTNVQMGTEAGLGIHSDAAGAEPGRDVDAAGAEPGRDVVPPAAWQRRRARIDEMARQAALRAIVGIAAMDHHVDEVPVEQMAEVAAEFNAAAVACAHRAQSFGAGTTTRVLADAAAEAAVRQVESEGQRICWDKVDIARAAALTATSADYESMLEKALQSVREKSLVITVQGYKGSGLELELSLSTLGGATFEVSFRRGAQVSDIAAQVHALRCSPSSPVVVKLVSPGGSVLEPSGRLPGVLGCEMEGAAGSQDMFHYPLSTLRGCTESAPWRELGLPGPTRWRHLPEDEFTQLFCMSKATFEQLPPWKQISLKKKHDLF